jgi:hypothetical protein
MFEEKKSRELTRDKKKNEIIIYRGRWLREKI